MRQNADKDNKISLSFMNLDPKLIRDDRQNRIF